MLVHVQDTGLLAAMHWVAIPVGFDESLVFTPRVLPRNWRRMPTLSSTQAFGDTWVAEGRSAVLRVPSAVTAGEFNYILNPRHAEFERLRIGSAERFSFDHRLL